MKYSLPSFSFRGMTTGEGSRLTWTGCLCVELPRDMSHLLRRGGEKGASEKGGGQAQAAMAEGWQEWAQLTQAGPLIKFKCGLHPAHLRSSYPRKCKF